MKKTLLAGIALIAGMLSSFAATKGSLAGHDAVQLWSGGPYWATMNPGATKPTQTGYYYYKGSDTKGFPVAGGKLKGTLGSQNSSTTLWSGGWRKPTTAEATKMKDTCVVESSGTDADGQPYVVIRGNTAGYTDNKVIFPLSGWANGKAASEGNGWGSQGKYWTSDEGTALRLCMSKTGIFLQNGASTHENYYTVRMVCDSAPGAYSGGGEEEDEPDDPAPSGNEVSPSGDKSGIKDAQSIQARIDAAAPGHGTVTLKAGTFYVNVELAVTNGVTLVGQGWKNTTITQTSKSSRVMKVTGGSTVKELAITGGSLIGNWANGGGVLVEDGTVSWCRIEGNKVTQAGSNNCGGGICINKGQLDHSIVCNNSVGAASEDKNRGGGIGVSTPTGDILIDTCLVYGNSAINESTHRSGQGGGIGIEYMYKAFTITIRNTTITGNTAGTSGGKNDAKGGGIFSNNDSGKKLRMINCIVTGNKTVGGSEVELAYAGGVDYCLFSYEVDGAGDNCKEDDPQFTSPETHEYMLSANSPAKKAGTTYSGIGVDLAKSAFANPPSMGCYEYASSASVTGDYYVSPTGNDSNSGTSRDKPFQTIQHAVDVAADGKTICVLKGTYNVKAPGTMYKNTAAITVDKAVKIIGDTGKPEDVVVHNSKDWVESGDYSVCYRVFLLNNAGAVISGLTVENGNAHGSGSDPKFFGANVFIDTNGGTVTNCIIRNGRSNTFAADVGKADPSTKGGVGGIACFSSQGLITHCVITNNFSSMGRTSTTQTVHDGGAAVYLSAGTLRQSLIAYNTVTEAWTGSAVYAAEGDGKTTLIENCTIVNNTYQQGPRIGNYSDSGQLYPIWIPLNTIDGSSRMPEIRNCVIYGNTTHNGSKTLIEWTRYNDAQYSKAKAAAAAAFVNCATDMTLPNGMTAVTSGIKLTSDFRPASGSSLINAGAAMKSPVTRDLGRITRVKGGAVDIGCYEFPDGEIPDEPSAHTHTWGEPVYMWTQTASGYTCKGSAICTGDSSHVTSKTVEATYKETLAPTTEKKGSGTYTAVFDGDIFTTQVKDVEIPVIHEHRYGDADYLWAGDGSACEARAPCEVCELMLIEDALSIETNLIAATCCETGHVAYVATFKMLGVSTNEYDLAPLGHAWGSQRYDWTETDSGWACAVSAVCTHDESHTTNENAVVTYQIMQAATDGRDGTGLYTAVFPGGQFPAQTKQVLIPKTGTGGGDDPSGEGGGDAGGHEGVKLTVDGPYWATMNCGANAVGEVGYYYYNWNDTVGFHVKGGGLTGAVEKNSSVTKWESPWRKPTEAEIRDLVSHCKVTETKTFNGVPCVKVSGTGDYADKYVWFPMAGYANGGSNAGSFGSLGKYWAEGSGGAILQHLMVYSGSLGTAAGGANHGNYYTMRLVADNLGPSHKHVWGEATYTWTPTDKGGWTCTGDAVCLSNSTHTATEKGTVSYRCLQAATDTVEGTGLFVATFANAPFSIQTKQVVIPVGGGTGEPQPDKPDDPGEDDPDRPADDSHEHDWGERTYIWTATDDGWECSASVTCQTDPTHICKETVVGVYHVIMTPTVDDAGYALYVAAFQSAPFQPQVRGENLPRKENKLPAEAGAIGIDGATDGHNAVQLWKDGPYWATENLGAKTETEFGYYYSFGGTTGYVYDDGWKDASGAEVDFPFTAANAPAPEWDENSVLLPEYDAANALWGENWRLPTAAERDDLCGTKYCSNRWVIVNGVPGKLFVGKTEGFTDKAIFLPAVGVATESSVNGPEKVDKNGYYYAGSVITVNSMGKTSVKAQSYQFVSNKVANAGITKDAQLFYLGCAIRAVCDEVSSDEPVEPEPERTETATTPVPVPYEWLVLNKLVAEGATEDEYEAAALAKAANGRTVWECYVAVLDPRSATDDLLADIEMVDEKPVISWSPSYPDIRDYEVIGKQKLTDAEWGPTNTASHFFKVKASLKQD